MVLEGLYKRLPMNICLQGFVGFSHDYGWALVQPWLCGRLECAAGSQVAGTGPGVKSFELIQWPQGGWDPLNEQIPFYSCLRLTPGEGGRTMYSLPRTR